MSERGGEQVQPGQSGHFQTQHAPHPTGPSSDPGPSLNVVPVPVPTMVVHTPPIHLSAWPHPPMPCLHLHVPQLPASRMRCAGSWLQPWWTSLSCYICFPVMNMLARIQEGLGEWGRAKSCRRPRHGCEGEPSVQAMETLPSLSPMTNIPDPWPREHLHMGAGTGHDRAPHRSTHEVA